MIRVLSVASEAYPWIKTGGLADVAGALPGALAPHGVAMTTLLPGYPAVVRGLKNLKLVHKYPTLLGSPARILEFDGGDHPLLVLDAPTMFARAGGPYDDAGGASWPDNWRRFAALARAAADLCSGVVAGKRFDILHAHDWQAAMAPAYLRFAPGPQPPAASVLTIHNIAFQGRFDQTVFKSLELPPQAYAINGVEYFGGVGFLKAGLTSCDAITTVSPGYAMEIRQPQFGMGLEGLIQARSGVVSGIINGIDGAIWNPHDDKHLTAPYGFDTMDRRAANKRTIETMFGLKPGNGPLFTVISRLTWQKGMDVLAGQLDALVAMGGRLALLGTGDAGLEAEFRAAESRHPGHIGVKTVYDEKLSHCLLGGADAIVIPSRFEPCGLTQLYGLAYGCIPVAARTGGLGDTIIDANEAAMAAEVATGVLFDGVTAEGMMRALERSMMLYSRPALWAGMQRQGMKADFSWRQSGAQYAALYTRLMPKPAAAPTPAKTSRRRD